MDHVFGHLLVVVPVLISLDLFTSVTKKSWKNVRLCRDQVSGDEDVA